MPRDMLHGGFDDGKAYVERNVGAGAVIGIAADDGERGGENEAVMLSFDTGMADSIHDLAVAKGERVGTLPEPSLEGYAFGGWYTDEDLTIPFAPDAIVSEPLTLYASYTEAYAVYGLFTDVSYDGETLTATLSYDYNRSSTDLLAVLYQDGRMLDIQSAEISSGAKTTTVTNQGIHAAVVCAAYSDAGKLLYIESQTVDVLEGEAYDFDFAIGQADVVKLFVLGDDSAPLCEARSLFTSDYCTATSWVRDNNQF